MGEREEVVGGGGGEAARERSIPEGKILWPRISVGMLLSLQKSVPWHLIDDVSVASPDEDLTENRGPCLSISEIVGDVA